MASETPTAEAILSRWFFPENLPPVFASDHLWSHYDAFNGAYLINKECVGSASIYNASKRGGQRRLFGLPHPTFVYDQGVFLEKHWAQIEPSLDKAVGSLSKPIFSDSGPRSVRITPHSELPKARLKKLSRFKYCVITDVARCFPSIYTRSVPWAIHGRAAAKVDRNIASASVFGNRLDFILRQAQDRQTIGIPVGPDTSRVTSKIILAAVDVHFMSASGKRNPTYLRHVDDYWIGGNSTEECENHLRTLRSSLRSFELDINELKTKIVSTNHVFGDSWPVEFDTLITQAFSPFLKADPIPTLSKIIDRATADNDDGMIRHVIRKLDEHKFWNSNWNILEHFLAQCAIQFPHSFDYVARVVAWRTRIEKDYDKSLWRDVTRLAAMQGSSLGRDSEVIWALWLMKELKIKPTQQITDSVIRNNGPLVLSFLAHMHSNGLTLDRKIPDKLRTLIDVAAYSGQNWPLSLELVHLGLDGQAMASAKAHPMLRLLHDQKETLIKWSAVPKVFLRDADEESTDEDFEPDFAIEDFTSDYETDEEDNDDEEIDFEGDNISL